MVHEKKEKAVVVDQEVPEEVDLEGVEVEDEVGQEDVEGVIQGLVHDKRFCT